MDLEQSKASSLLLNVIFLTVKLDMDELRMSHRIESSEHGIHMGSRTQRG